MKLNHIFCLSVVLAGICLFSAGCSRKTQVPEPPTARAQLIQELFSAMGSGDHQTALKKLERLRMINSGNIFLANLEVFERNNAMISEIQSLIDQGKIDDAINLTNEFILKNGKTETFSSILNELQILKQLSESVAALNDSSNVTRLARSAAKIKMLASKYKPAAALLPLANEKIALAKKLYTSEKRKAADDLSIEIIGMISKKDPRSALLMPVLGIENPEHPVILDYLDYISGPSVEKWTLGLVPEKSKFSK